MCKNSVRIRLWKTPVTFGKYGWWTVPLDFFGRPWKGFEIHASGFEGSISQLHCRKPRKIMKVQHPMRLASEKNGGHLRVAYPYIYIYIWAMKDDYCIDYEGRAYMTYIEIEQYLTKQWQNTWNFHKSVRQKLWSWTKTWNLISNFWHMFPWLKTTLQPHPSAPAKEQLPKDGSDAISVDQGAGRLNSYTLHGTNISHWGKRKLIFKTTLVGDIYCMLVLWRVS